jgi:HD superfamily phosphodiesterase
LKISSSEKKMKVVYQETYSTDKFTYTRDQTSKDEKIPIELRFYMWRFNVHEKIAMQLFEYMKKHTKNWDDTHNHTHILQVISNLNWILDYTEKGIDFSVILFVAILHEIFDHKYLNNSHFSASRQTHYDAIFKIIGFNTNRILNLIENVSFTREREGKQELFADPDNKHLDYVCDADRLAAIGDDGLKRCFDYQNYLYPTFSKDKLKELVRIHYGEKLSILVSGGYFKTESGLRIAKVKHYAMEKYYIKYFL